MITENLSTLKIHKLSQAQYERESAAGRIDENALYLVPDIDNVKIQPNWDQNDESAADYIKNRTHYMETYEDYLFQNIQTDEEMMIRDNHSLTIKPIFGETYLFIIDGIEYNLRCIYEDDDWRFGFGNLDDTKIGIVTDDPIGIIYTPYQEGQKDHDGDIGIVIYSGNYHAVNISCYGKIVNKVKKLDKIYLPEEYVSREDYDYDMDYIEDDIKHLQKNAIRVDRKQDFNEYEKACARENIGIDEVLKELTSEDAIALAIETGLIDPIVTLDNYIFTDVNNNIIIL